MKTFSSNLQTEKASSETATCYAIEIDTSTPTRICNWDTDIVFNSDTYLSGRAIANIRVTNGPNPTCSFFVGNADDVFTSLMLNNSLKQKAISIYEVFFDDDNNVIDGEVLFKGIVEFHQLPNSLWCEIHCTPYTNSTVIRCPRRPIAPSCGFIFRSTECGYVGTETSCVKTYEGCHNKTRFSGFRFIPKPGTVFVWGSNTIEVK